MRNCTGLTLQKNFILPPDTYIITKNHIMINCRMLELKCRFPEAFTLSQLGPGHALVIWKRLHNAITSDLRKSKLPTVKIYSVICAYLAYMPSGT